MGICLPDNLWKLKEGRKDIRLLIYWCITNACDDSWWLMRELMQGYIISL